MKLYIERFKNLRPRFSVQPHYNWRGITIRVGGFGLFLHLG